MKIGIIVLKSNVYFLSCSIQGKIVENPMSYLTSLSPQHHIVKQKQNSLSSGPAMKIHLAYEAE